MEQAAAAMPPAGAGPTPRKVASTGAKMMRRSEVIGAVRKLIAFSHAEADRLGAASEVHEFQAVRMKIAGYYQVLTELRTVPVFLNPADTPAAPADDSSATEEE